MPDRDDALRDARNAVFNMLQGPPLDDYDRGIVEVLDKIEELQRE